MEGKEEIISLLLTKEVDVNIRDNWGRTALHWACLQCHESCALRLISSQPKLDLKDQVSSMSINALRAVDLLLMSPIFLLHTFVAYTHHMVLGIHHGNPSIPHHDRCSVPLCTGQQWAAWTTSSGSWWAEARWSTARASTARPPFTTRAHTSRRRPRCCLWSSARTLIRKTWCRYPQHQHTHPNIFISLHPNSPPSPPTPQSECVHGDILGTSPFHHSNILSFPNGFFFLRPGSLLLTLFSMSLLPCPLSLVDSTNELHCCGRAWRDSLTLFYAWYRTAWTSSALMTRGDGHCTGHAWTNTAKLQCFSLAPGPMSMQRQTWDPPTSPPHHTL